MNRSGCDPDSPFALAGPNFKAHLHYIPSASESTKIIWYYMGSIWCLVCSHQLGHYSCAPCGLNITIFSACFFSVIKCRCQRIGQVTLGQRAPMEVSFGLAWFYLASAVSLHYRHTQSRVTQKYYCQAWELLEKTWLLAQKASLLWFPLIFLSCSKNNVSPLKLLVMIRTVEWLDIKMEELGGGDLHLKISYINLTSQQ